MLDILFPFDEWCPQAGVTGRVAFAKGKHLPSRRQAFYDTYFSRPGSTN
jgi:hypothetical protein